MTHFDDSIVKTVAEALAATNPMTMPGLVHNLNRLFNRMTFRYEATWECARQGWGERLYAALQTWALLDEYRSFVEQQGKEHYRTYDSMAREVYRYCDYMLG